MKSVPDIIFEQEEVKESKHKPRYAASSASSGFNPDNRFYNCGEAVMAQDKDGVWKGGIVQTVQTVGFKRTYKVKLSSAHQSRIVETEKVYGRNVT